MTSSNAQQLLAVASILGDLGAAISSQGRAYKPQTEDNEFVQMSKYCRSLSRPRMFYSNNGRPYVKPVVPGEIKGKLAIKWAKKLRVKALQAEQKERVNA